MNWDSNRYRWADTHEKKEKQAITRLNKYVADDELDKLGMVYTDKDIHNKIDLVLQKAKQFYSTYRRIGKKLYDLDVEMDLEAAKSAWPNFGVFYSCFKNLAAIGASTSIEDMVAISAAVELDPEMPSTLSSVQSENVDDSSETKIEKELVPKTSKN